MDDENEIFKIADNIILNKCTNWVDSQNTSYSIAHINYRKKCVFQNSNYIPENVKLDNIQIMINAFPNIFLVKNGHL